MSNSLHLELTNRCVLACPACPRTTWRELTKMPLSKSDLDIDVLKKFLDCDGGQEIDTFVLCGDYGDCIYYPQLFEFIKEFRSSKKFIISTNGSNQTEKFWTTLKSLLIPGDKIIFGIDGLEDTNHLYRRNANWASVMMGLDIMVQSTATVVWQTIVFSFNYNQLLTIKQFAESKGAEFLCLKTHRYEDSTLIPPDDYIELNHIIKDDYINKNDFVIDPACNQEKAVTADGYLFPCDWIRNPRTLYRSQLWKQKSRWIDKVDMRNTNYDQAVLVIQDWANYVRDNSIKGSPDVDVLCKMKCREGCRQEQQIFINHDYATGGP